MKHVSNGPMIPEAGLQKKRRHTGWVLAVVIPLVIVIAGLFVFSKFLYGVEYYSPTVQLENYIELVRAKDYKGAMDFIGLKTASFNSLEAYTVFFQNYYGDMTGKNYVFTERKLHRTEQSNFYDVQIAKNVTQKFKLTRTGEKKLYLFDTWKVELESPIPTRTVLIHTPSGVSIDLNGTAITPEFRKTDSTFSLDYYKNVKDDNKKFAMDTYQVDGLVAITSLEAKTSGGEPCVVTLLEEKDSVSTYLVNLPIPKDQVEGLKTLTETMTKKYAEFVAKDVSFAEFSPYLYKNTKLYDDLKEFYNGWFTGHQSYGFEDLKFFGLQSFDDTHCVVGIEFKYFVYKSDVRFDYQVKYNVYLLKVQGKWLIADLIVQ